MEEYNMGLNNYCSGDDENIIFKIKKSDIKKTTGGKYKLNIVVSKEVVSKILKKKEIKINPIPGEIYYNLSKREVEVLRYIVEGKTNREIAGELVVSKYTIKAHVANILQKMQVEDRVQAVVKAIIDKIIEI